MRRRTYLTRVCIAGAAAVSGALAGCLSRADSITDDSPDGGPEEAVADDSDDDQADESEADESEADEGDGTTDGDPLESYELGGVDDVEEPDVLVVEGHGADGEELSIDLTVELERSGETLEETLDLPAGGYVDVVMDDRDGYTVTVETDGSSAQTTISRSGDEHRSRTTVVVSETGTAIESKTESTSTARVR